MGCSGRGGGTFPQNPPNATQPGRVILRVAATTPTSYGNRSSDSTSPDPSNFSCVILFLAVDIREPDDPSRTNGDIHPVHEAGTRPAHILLSGRIALLCLASFVPLHLAHTLVHSAHACRFYCQACVPANLAAPTLIASPRGGTALAMKNKHSGMTPERSCVPQWRRTCAFRSRQQPRTRLKTT